MMNEHFVIYQLRKLSYLANLDNLDPSCNHQPSMLALPQTDTKTAKEQKTLDHKWNEMNNQTLAQCVPGIALLVTILVFLLLTTYPELGGAIIGGMTVLALLGIAVGFFIHRPWSRATEDCVDEPDAACECIERMLKRMVNAGKSELTEFQHKQLCLLHRSTCPARWQQYSDDERRRILTDPFASPGVSNMLLTEYGLLDP